MPYCKLYGEGGADYVNEYSRGWRLDAREVPADLTVRVASDRRVQLMGEIEGLAAGSANAVSADLTDTVVISLGFKNGATGVISNSIAAPLASRLQIYGTERWAASRGPRHLSTIGNARLWTSLFLRKANVSISVLILLTLSPPTSQTLLTP